jgi:hypothetical protein
MDSQRALALIAGHASRLSDAVMKLQDLAADLPLEIRLEVNNLDEVLDLLRYKIREETLRRALGSPADLAATTEQLPLIFEPP